MSSDRGLVLRFSSLQFTFGRQEAGASRGKRFTAKFFATKNCTASTFKDTKYLSLSVCDVLVECLNSNK